MPYIIAGLTIVVLGVGFTLFRSTAPAETTEIVSLSSSSIARGDVVAVPAGDVDANNGSADATATAFKDGSYDTVVTYLTPLRTEYKLDVELTVKDGVVTGADVGYSQGAEKDPNAQRFEAAYKTEVIGKSLDSINLSRVGGASLTTGAFNNALAEIKADAAA